VILQISIGLEDTAESLGWISSHCFSRCPHRWREHQTSSASHCGSRCWMRARWVRLNVGPSRVCNDLPTRFTIRRQARTSPRWTPFPRPCGWARLRRLELAGAPERRFNPFF